MSATAPRTRRKSLYLALEQDGGSPPAPTPGVDPSADGSDYDYVPTEALAAPLDQKAPITTETSTGRPYPTESEEGPDGAALNGVRMPLVGLPSSPGDQVNASTVPDTWRDILFRHALGVQQTTQGRNVTSSTNGGLVLAGDVLGVQDLVPVFEANVPAGRPRVQWGLVTAVNDPGDYGVAPNWVANPSSAAVARGAKIYRDTDEGGPTLAAVVVDDTLRYRMLMGRCNSLRFTADHGKKAFMEAGFAFDSKVLDAGKTALPAAVRTTPTPIKFSRSPVWFNGSRISTRSLEITLGVAAAALGGSAGDNGRVGNELISIAPTIVIEPLRNDDYLEYKRAQTTKGRCLVQVGAGILTAGVLNSYCFHFELVEAREVTDVDDNGRVRHRIVFHAVDRIEFVAGVGARFFQMALA